MTILTGDCRDLMPDHGDADMAERAQARVASVLPFAEGTRP